MNTLTGLQNTVDTLVSPVLDGMNTNGLVHFKEYDSQLSIPEVAGTRIVKCLYQVAKTGKNAGKKAGENAYIRIPSDHINEQVICDSIAELAPYVVSYLQDKEDMIIKEAHRKGQLNFHTSGLSLAAIIEYLEENETSGRLNKEMIEAWFTQVIADNLADLFAQKLGLHADSSEQELVKLQTVIHAYKTKLASLASPKVSFKPEDCAALIGVISKADVDGSVLGKRFIKKLETMMNKEEDCLMSL